VEVAQTFVVQERLQRGMSPPLTGPQNVLLFGLVQFAAGGDIGQLQPLAVIAIEWGVAVTERKQWIARGGHRGAGALGCSHRWRSSTNRSAISFTRESSTPGSGT